MAGARVLVSIDDAQVQRALRRLARNVARARPAFDEIGAAVATSTQQRFEDQRNPQGKPWPPLAKSTQESRVTKRRKRGSANILRVRGHLYNSITSAATHQEAFVGTNRAYGALHQFGGTPEMKNPGARAVPARLFLGLSKQDQDVVLRILATHLMDGV